MIKRGAKFRIAPYGLCVVESFDDTSGMYLVRRWNSSEIFYVKREKLEKRLDKSINL